MSLQPGTYSHNNQIFPQITADWTISIFFFSFVFPSSKMKTEHELEMGAKGSVRSLNCS